MSALFSAALGRSEVPGYAEDVAAEAFSAAYEKRERYDPRLGCLDQWLLGIARNHARDFLRAHAELREEQSLEGELVIDVMPAPSPASPDAGATHEEASPRVLAVRRALGRLRDYDRELLTARVVSALGYDELERHFDFAVRKGTLRVHVRRARLRLLRELAKEAALKELLERG